MVKDSIINEESTKKIAELQIRYETDKKESNIKLLENEKQIQALKLTKQQNLRNLFIIISILIIVIVVFVYYQYKIKKKMNIILEEKNIALEIINKKLAKSRQDKIKLNQNTS